MRSKADVEVAARELGAAIVARRPREDTDLFTFVYYRKRSPDSDSARRETPKTGQLVSVL